MGGTPSCGVAPAPEGAYMKNTLARSRGTCGRALSVAALLHSGQAITKAAGIGFFAWNKPREAERAR